ncbi:hypothetical protein RB195_012120 [Necator americanus]|uniref:Uncharacterized protein n=1 Tax=Necator americanus TaxID=51031 RepID=A0ABR1D777_NECAM
MSGCVQQGDCNARFEELRNLFPWTSGKDNGGEDEPYITVSFNSLEAHPNLPRAVRYLKRDSGVLLYRFHKLMKDANFHIISFEVGDRLTAHYALKGVDCPQFINFLLLSAKGVYHIRDAFVVCNEKEVSAVLGKKTLFLSTLTDKAKDSTENEGDNSMNLQFQEKYGTIVAHVWYNDGYMIVGFEKGFVVCISAHPSEMGQEIFSVAEYKTYLASVAASQPFGKILSIGDHQIKIREMRELNDIFVIMEVDTEKDLSQIECSIDGQLVAVAARGGGLSVYLTKMPSMGAAFGDTVAVLSSLNQVTYLPEGDKQRSIVINIAIEPSLIAVGPSHIAVATNNRVWMYDVHQLGSNQPVAEGDYLSTVNDVKLNDEYICVVMEGKARLHRIINSDSYPSITFPEQSRNSKLLAAALSNHFLIFSTEASYLVFFSIAEWCVVSEYRHTSPIRQIHPDADGLRTAILDERTDTWIYSPVDDSMHKLPAIGSAVHYKSALWETFTIDRDTFVVYDNTSIYVYLLNRSQIEGESVIYIGSTKLPFAHTPLMLSKGIVHCLTSSGKTSSVLLESHRTDTVLEGKPQTVIRDLLKQALLLKR